MLVKKCSNVVFLSLWAVGLLFTSAVFAYEYVPEPITPSDYVDYWNGAGVYAPKPIQPNTNSNSYSSPSYTNPSQSGNTLTPEQAAMLVKMMMGQNVNQTKKDPHENFVKWFLGKAVDEATVCWAPPTMEEYIRTFFKLTVSDVDLRRLCEAQFITNYRVAHYKAFTARLKQIEAKSKGKDATALIVAYAKELEERGPKVIQKREAWPGLPVDSTTIESVTQNLQRIYSERKCSFDSQIFKSTVRAIYSRSQKANQLVTFGCCLDRIGDFNNFLKNNGMKSDMNKSLLNYTQWLKNTNSSVPDTIFVPSNGFSKKELRKDFWNWSLVGCDDKHTICWAPPTMEEYIRTFFTLNVTDAALRRLCEAQFITNYNVAHYKAFIARLQQIEEKLRGKDATTQINAYAKELEGKGAKVMQEREAWLGEPADVTQAESGILKWVAAKGLSTEKGHLLDSQILTNTARVICSRCKTYNQCQTLACCMLFIADFNAFLKNKGLDSDLNKSLSNYTQWLKHTKGSIPATNYIN